MAQVAIAKVAVSAATFAFDRPFSYKISPGFDGVRPGCRVIVPFSRGNRPCEGIVLSVGSAEDAPGLKAVLKVLDEEPVLTAEQIRLAVWMHDRFFCTVYNAVKVILPAGVWFQISTVYHITEGMEEDVALEACGKSKARRLAVETVFAHGGSCDLADLQAVFGEEDPTNALHVLVKKGVLRFEGAEKRRVKDKETVYASLNLPAEDAQEEIRLRRKKAPQQAAILDLLCTVGRAPAREVCLFTGASMVSLKALVNKELVRLDAEPAFRRPVRFDGEIQPIPALTDAQSAAYDGLHALLEQPKANAALLFGVTGSGKTTVYLHLIDGVLRRGGSSILLVPEISLTPQMIQTFSAYFGDSVAVLHSSLSIGERYDEWKRIRQGDARVIIGTRSAVFAPAVNLGLLILDEEQEETYKSENTPRYHARDVAKFRCVQHDALLLLGSATPDVVSRYQAEIGKYHYFEIQGRFNARALPDVSIVDMKRELRQGNLGSISSVLRRELEENLTRGEQSILFLNRRGASKLVTCGDCGFTYSCPRCSVSLTYHRSNDMLMCHHCGYRRRLDKQCPDCGGALHYIGDGTQKIEDELNELFPGVATLRMDADTIAMAGSHEKLLTRFSEEKIPIMIGTQMITKGLNFDRVTLVGVLSADQSLYVGDYRANERTFSLITQVVGRSGRGDAPGRAVIQTFTPENQTILQAAAQDYEAFYRSEIELRKLHGTPPFCEILTVTASGLNESSVLRCCAYIRDYLQRETHGEIQILGPAPLPVVRVNNRYRYRVTLYCKEKRALRQTVANIVMYCNTNQKFRDVSVFADDNPFD